jgi:hypothetical protein
MGHVVCEPSQFIRGSPESMLCINAELSTPATPELLNS